MLKNIYVLKIDNKKILKKLIKYKIYFEKIIYKDGYILIEVDYYNYCHILKFKKVFEIELVSVKGVSKYKFLLKKYSLFFISNLIGITIIILLSNIIFSVKIITNDKEIYNLLLNELNYYKISPYNFVKTYKEKEEIKKKILNDNRDKLEWIEITRTGSLYTINVERRIINHIDNDNTIRDVVSKKNAFIKEIRASSGYIVKKINDYVNKGDIIVSGRIMKGDEVKNYVKADAKVYGETWYNVHITLPINYYEKVYTGKSKKRLTINFLNKKIKLFNFKNYKNEEIREKTLLESRLFPFSVNYDTFYEIEETIDILTDEKVWDIAFNIAREKLLSTLKEDSEILSQKKLKLIVKDSKIEIDVFVKVYENITDYRNIEISDTK